MVQGYDRIVADLVQVFMLALNWKTRVYWQIKTGNPFVFNLFVLNLLSSKNMIQ